MAAKRPKAPAGCYWRGNTLWGRSREGGQAVRWSLETDDPVVAAQRRQKGQQELNDCRHGDGRRLLGAVIEEWHQEWLSRNKAELTADRYLCSLGQLAPFLEGKALREIDGQLIATIIKARGKLGVTNATIKRDLVALSSVMNYAIHRGWHEVNPVLPRMKLIEERRDPIVLPDFEHVGLVVARSPGLIAQIIRLAVATGARQDELLKARRDQIDHKRKQLTVVGKRNKRRVIELEPFDGYEVVRSIPDGATPYLFWHGNGETYKNFASQFAEVSKRTEVWAKINGVPFRRFRFHDLRHLHAVNWLKDGRSIYDLQRRLGHTSIKTTEGYCEFLTPEEDRIVKGLANAR